MDHQPLPQFASVSRRAMLKKTLGVGAIALVPGLACGNADAETFAGAVAESTTTTEPTTTTAPPTTAPPTTAEPTTTAQTGEGSTTDGTAVDPNIVPAVNGELIVEFTYTQGAGGLNERPYIAVWVEDEAGNLVTTISLWYELGRRGQRWLDHLDAWYQADVDFTAAGGESNRTTISSATRNPGAYAVAWDGTTPNGIAPAGNYSICIEAAREEGPHSFVCQPVTLSGTLAPVELPDNSELSAMSVRIDV